MSSSGHGSLEVAKDWPPGRKRSNGSADVSNGGSAGSGDYGHESAPVGGRTRSPSNSPRQVLVYDDDPPRLRQEYPLTATSADATVLHGGRRLPVVYYPRTPRSPPRLVSLPPAVLVDTYSAPRGRSASPSTSRSGSPSARARRARSGGDRSKREVRFVTAAGYPAPHCCYPHKAPSRAIRVLTHEPLHSAVLRLGTVVGPGANLDEVHVRLGARLRPTSLNAFEFFRSALPGRFLVGAVVESLVDFARPHGGILRAGTLGSVVGPSTTMEADRVECLFPDIGSVNMAPAQLRRRSLPSALRVNDVVQSKVFMSIRNGHGYVEELRDRDCGVVLGPALTSKEPRGRVRCRFAAPLAGGAGPVFFELLPTQLSRFDLPGLLQVGDIISSLVHFERGGGVERLGVGDLGTVIGPATCKDIIQTRIQCCFLRMKSVNLDPKQVRKVPVLPGGVKVGDVVESSVIPEAIPDIDPYGLDD
eukprot:TRINITY_DN37481_c0_g1_i1.p1 TRINITY_DN37481_c0_g1~~TRINITY_DN37481_c0_g1_i1.p1  ORF type:complete len:475 (-),score=55.63 TRINITY_DN37481_c0_g1_i1:384-1808(-)